MTMLIKDACRSRCRHRARHERHSPGREEIRGPTPYDAIEKLGGWE
jgi:hypothetical protein